MAKECGGSLMITELQGSLKKKLWKKLWEAKAISQLAIYFISVKQSLTRCWHIRGFTRLIEEIS